MKFKGITFKWSGSGSVPYRGQNGNFPNKEV